MPSPLRALVVAFLVSACTVPPIPPPDSPMQTPGSADAAGPSGPKRPKVAFDSPGGMWTPAELATQGDKLRALGLELDPKALGDPLGMPLGAVVGLGGCSASFVSTDGLVATNHHCVTGALQYNSTPKENLLKLGFHAKSRADERWAGPTQHLFVTQSFQDVTKEVRAGLDPTKSDLERFRLVERRIKELVAGCEKGRPEVRCSVPAYAGGAQFVLITELELKDVRLVFAPPESIGNYGGEVDNWRWPRHSGDFSFYRAYAGPDQKPAEHAAANVPYKPPHHLRLASRPLEEGDFVFVAGYPGATNRLRTAGEVGEALGFLYPHQIKLYEENAGLLRKISEGDADLAIKARPLVRSLDNGLGKTRGLVDGLTKDGLAAKKEKVDKELRAWIDADATRKAKYGDVFAKIDAILAKKKATREADAFQGEVLRLVRLFSAAETIVRMAEERPKPDAERDPAYQARNWQRLEQEQEALERRYDRKMDTALLALNLKRQAALPKAERSPLLEIVTGGGEATAAAIDKAIEKIWATTKLEDTKKRLELLKKATTGELRQGGDGLVQLALAARPVFKAQEEREHAIEGALVVQRPRFIEALRAFTPTPIPADANRTLRVTFGTVKGYRPKPDAPVYRPFSLPSELAKKSTGKDPFAAPKPLLDAIAEKRFGARAAPELGEVPVDFLADLDITGGNSGSPAMNAKGELVGLAFDGNYEAMASDWLFMPEVTRSIQVDVRYVLWVLELYGAGELVREMEAG